MALCSKYKYISSKFYLNEKNFHYALICACVCVFIPENRKFFQYTVYSSSPFSPHNGYTTIFYLMINIVLLNIINHNAQCCRSFRCCYDMPAAVFSIFIFGNDKRWIRSIYKQRRRRREMINDKSMIFFQVFSSTSSFSYIYLFSKLHVLILEQQQQQQQQKEIPYI